MEHMEYLFAAFAAVWIILALYLFSIQSREKKLRADIEALKKKLVEG
jgi:CcmD family protein